MRTVKIGPDLRLFWVKLCISEFNMFDHGNEGVVYGYEFKSRTARDWEPCYTKIVHKLFSYRISFTIRFLRYYLLQGLSILTDVFCHKRLVKWNTIWRFHDVCLYCSYEIQHNWADRRVLLGLYKKKTVINVIKKPLFAICQAWEK